MTFRFEAILRLRKNTENLKQREMALVQQALVERQNHKRHLANSGDKNKQELQTRLGQPLDGRTLGLYDRYFQSLQTRSTVQEKLIHESQLKVEAHRAELVEAMRKRRVLEILKERAVLEHRRKILKNEISFLDEISAARWQRSMI